MANMQKWTGALFAIMGIAHCMATDWMHLRAAAGQGWWMSVDTMPESQALWFLVAGISLIIIGFFAFNSLTTRIAAAMLVTLLMLGIYTGTGLVGAAIGTILGGALIAATLKSTKRTTASQAT